MENGNCQLDVPKMSRALLLTLATGSTSQVTIDSAEFGVEQAALPRPMSLFIHGLGILHVHHAHPLDLIRREESELDLLYGLEGSI